MKSPSNLIRLYLVFLSALALIPISFVQAADSPIPETVHLTVHYQRNASDYTDWNVYLWRDVTGSGDKEVSAAGFPFTSEVSIRANVTYLILLLLFGSGYCNGNTSTRTILLIS